MGDPVDLATLFAKHGTDKAILGYGPLYERYLGKEMIRLLVEIGVEAGKSLRAWSEWAGWSTVVGVDLRLPDGPFPSNVSLWQGSGTDETLAQQIINAAGRPDVMVDDGSHRWTEQQAAFATWWPLLLPGGWYVIEDLHTSFDQRWGEGAKESTVDWLGRLTSCVHGTSWVKPREHSDLNIGEVHCHDMICFIRKRGLKDEVRHPDGDLQQTQAAIPQGGG